MRRQCRRGDQHGARERGWCGGCRGSAVQGRRAPSGAELGRGEGSTQAGAVQVRRSLGWERADAAAEEAAQC